MALSLVQHQQADSITVQVVGEVDVSCANQLRDALYDAIEHTTSQVIVDLSDMPYIDSTGIGVLMGSVHHAHNQQKTLIAAHPTKNVMRVFGMLGVVDALGIQED